MTAPEERKLPEKIAFEKPLLDSNPACIKEGEYVHMFYMALLDRIANEYYKGLENHAERILFAAAENNRFYDFVKKLNEHYFDVLAGIEPSLRLSQELAAGRTTRLFLVECYKDLGMKIKDDYAGA